MTDGSAAEMPVLFTAVGGDAAGSRLLEHCEDAGVCVDHVTVRVRTASHCVSHRVLHCVFDTMALCE
jgi:sugar/nucleoside kinase (ribokinase family)